MSLASEPRFTIGIIEDDEQLASILARQLLRYAFDPRLIDCLGDIVGSVEKMEPHVILLDINLPQFDGFYWCRRIREITRAPIIFVSARNAGMDQVFALENGGDDFVVKPFDMDVLVAKLRAHIRRVYGEYAADDRVIARKLVFGPMQLDDRRLQLHAFGSSTPVTKTECELLRQLMEAEGRAVSRDTLLAALWDDMEFVDDNTLTVNVTRLRRKLADLGCDHFIRTVRGLGYQLVVPDDVDVDASSEACDGNDV
ncbi:response regulator transcription factor [Alicyclobacillus dauci]|uniref:Response regulator transcription factor n=1 Tax=Alicyclobacillus dauci TaxID=1475485 RepID=A0ABY6Z5B3_9BACL|nr:response regulator transcription factor [Alicyclobacillus dauci]WAH37713.1 response regulator transcription factor [Alicyclobacillus dauci]